MQRRQFLLALPAAIAVAPDAHGFESLAYRPGLLEELQRDGTPFVLNFRTSWSFTCQRKSDILSDLHSTDPALAGRLRIVEVDWDIWGKSRFVERLDVPRRSTLIAMRGTQEVGRLVADPDARRIRALIDTALAR